jgi:hypothetical protein
MLSVRDIMDRIAADPTADEVGQLSNDLVHAINRTGAVDDLRPFLSAPEPALVEIGAWVASELGSGCAPLLDQLLPLFGHPIREVRFYAVNCLLASHGSATGRDLAAVLGLLDDAEAAVRAQATDFLARAPEEALQRTLAHVESAARASSDARGLRWLLNEGARDPAAVIAAIQDPDARFRKYAAAAAARMSGRDRAPLVHAATADDPDVGTFAASWLKMNAAIEDARRRRER